MRVFLTGATGFIGSAVAAELIKAGHQVLGIARSDAGAAALCAAGVEVHRGDLADVQSLKSGTSRADGVIHFAFDNEVSHLLASCELDRRAIEALGSALTGSDRPLIVTSITGAGIAEPHTLATEDVLGKSLPDPRIVSEVLCASLAESGVNVSVVRNPQVHDANKQGLITPMIAIARQKEWVAYVGDGSQRWPAAHIADVARLYVLALERGRRGARYHAVAEEGIAAKDIAETIGRTLRLPVHAILVEAASGYFGPLSMFAGRDMPASSANTRQRLGWDPTGRGLIQDLEQMR